jgi:hypothetical protein
MAGVLGETDLESGDLGAEAWFEALEALFAVAMSGGRVDDEQRFHNFPLGTYSTGREK